MVVKNLNQDKNPGKSCLQLNEAGQSTVLLLDDDYVNYLYFSELIEEGGRQLIRAVSLGQVLFKLNTNRSIQLLLITSTFASKFNYKIGSYIRQKYPLIPQIAIWEAESPSGDRHIVEENCDLLLNKYTDSLQLNEAISDLQNISENVRFSRF